MFIDRIEFDPAGLREAGSYAAELPLLKNASAIELDSPVTFFVGENGSGKSTLLEAVAVEAGFNPEGGGPNFSFHTRETHSDLCDHIRLVKGTRRWKDGWFLRAESFYNVATAIDEMDEQPAASRKIVESYGGRSLHSQSHGESFFALLQNRLGGNGLYLFDEPEAALSPMRQIAMLGILHRLVEEGSQFLISTHSPILSAYPGARIYEIGEWGVRPAEWKKTDNVVMTKRFLDNPERFFRQLF